MKEGDSIFYKNALNASARSCVETMELLNKNSEISIWLISFHILASTSLELFAKLILLNKGVNEGVEIKRILEGFMSLSHELHRLYTKDNLGKDFLDQVGINKVKNINNETSFFYAFNFKNKDILVYNPESLKYWNFSTNRPNCSVVAYQTDDLLELCQEVQNTTNNYIS